MKVKKLIYILIFLSFSIFIVVLGLEFLVRILLPEYHPSGNLNLYLDETAELHFPRKNAQLRHRARTGDWDILVDINHYGFRDKKDLQNSKPKDFFLVGDSFSFGWGVEESKRYSSLLESMLKIPVYNISMPEDLAGYEKLIKYAQKNGAAIHNLIVGVCMENDLRNYETPTYKPNIPTSKMVLWKARLKSFLEKNSAVYIAFATLSHQNKVLEKIFITLGIMGDYTSMRKRVYLEKAIRSSVKKVVEITESFKAYIVIIPSRFLWVGEYTEIEDRIHQEFVNSLRQSGLEVIDLRPFFEKGGDPMQYHFKRNPHWNAKGHLKAAKAIAAYLQDKISDVRVNP